MWAKILLGILFLAMAGAAFYFDPARDRSLLGVPPSRRGAASVDDLEHRPRES